MKWYDDDWMSKRVCRAPQPFIVESTALKWVSYGLIILHLPTSTYIYLNLPGNCSPPL